MNLLVPMAYCINNTMPECCCIRHKICFSCLEVARRKNIYWKDIYNVCNFCKQTSLGKHLVIRFRPLFKNECQL
jgi:hypothetical protein